MLMNDTKSIMTDKRHGTPLDARRIGNKYIIAIYQGSRGERPELDFRIAYREYTNNDKRTQIRQFRHMHLAVDLLIKKQNDKKLITKFIQHMLSLYDKIPPLKTKEEQTALLNNIHFDEFNKFANIPTIEFSYYIIYLLIVAEKTSCATAHVFKKLLEKLTTDDFYGIVSTATNNGKK